MLNIKIKASLFSGLLLVCGAALGQSPSQPKPKNCEGAPVYTRQGLEARDADEVKALAQPACQRLSHQTDQTILIGTVTKLVKREGTALLDGDCSYTSLQTATIAVREVFFGMPGKTVVIEAGDINSYYFDQNRTYLVVARQEPDGGLSVTGSGGTKLLSLAKDDLAYLHSWRTLPQDGRLYGNIYLSDGDRIPMVPITSAATNYPLSITGPKTVNVRTSTLGEYSTSGMPPGIYTVQLQTELVTYPDHIQTVDIAPRGCAKVDFHVQEAPRRPNRETRQ